MGLAPIPARLAASRKGLRVISAIPAEGLPMPLLLTSPLRDFLQVIGAPGVFYAPHLSEVPFP